MADTEKQEGQKTVVAFIAGLLIGGLLVWVFSSSPEDAPVDENMETDTEMTDDSNDAETDDSKASSNTSASSQTPSQSTSTPRPTGDGDLSVNDQTAGQSVSLATVEFPADAGWVVVRDFMDETPGPILGASRFSLTDGLTPESVKLIRATEAGKTYHVSFFSESGDKKFNAVDDKMIEGTSDTFVAR